MTITFDTGGHAQFGNNADFITCRVNNEDGKME